MTQQERLARLLDTLKRAAQSANLAKARGENLRRIQGQLFELGVAGHVRCVWHGDVRLVEARGAEAKKRYYVFTDGMVVSEDDALPPPDGDHDRLERRALLRVEDVVDRDRGHCFKIVYKGGREEVLRCGNAKEKERWIKELHMADVRAVMQRGLRGGTDMQVRVRRLRVGLLLLLQAPCPART